MKRFFALLFILALTVGWFTGCNKDSADNAQDLTVNPDGLSLEENGIVYESLAQKAVVKTALAYLARGDRAQYDDTRLNVREAPATDGVLYRWQSGVRKSPEEYTSQHNGYLNCAAFIHDVYLAALDLDIGVNYTGHLAAIDDARRVYQYLPTGKETAEEKAAVEQAFYATLKMGDIIVVRDQGNSGNGHTTLYVGTDVMKIAEGKALTEDTIYDCVHSSGTNYIYESVTEQYETNGTVGKTTTRHLFDKTNSRYAFKLKSLTIIRPLNTFDKEVPENSKNRMLNLQNIVAEKLSSHRAGMTVNPGGNITYTFSITNKNQTDVTLAVKDTVPENTTFVSSENVSKIGKNLTWTVTVPAGETKTVSYEVKVGSRVKAGAYIESTAGSVGGVCVKCPDVYVGTTLTQEQQTALCGAVDAYADSDLRGMALVNAVYGDVLNDKNLLSEDAVTVLGKLFHADGDYFYLESEKNAYTNAIAPGLFGGRYVPQRGKTESLAQQLRRYEDNRTRLPKVEQLIAGDILIAAQNAEGTRQRVFLYTGEKFLNVDTFVYVEPEVALTPTLSYNRFAVLRPSLMLDNKK